MRNAKQLSGVYVRSLRSGLWGGRLFLHSGPYQGGAFGFRLYIQPGFPATTEPPRFFFTTDLFHPQVTAPFSPSAAFSLAVVDVAEPPLT